MFDFDRSLFRKKTQSEPIPLLISVVVPTYRRPDILFELLSALVPQVSGAKTEVLVIDNCPNGSAQETLQRFDCPQLHYVHEPTPGVVHARNRGVDEAHGEYVLFIDDDEVPGPSWLAAFSAQAKAGVAAAFGHIQARYETDPDADVKPMLEQMFTRDFDVESGGHITEHHPVLGCGNAMFHKETCLTGAETFRADFNQHGGEDSALIRQLIARGLPLIWVPEGSVEEVVPSDRQTLAFLKARRFNQGRLRSKLNFERSIVSGLFWMAVGAAQIAVFTVLMVRAAFKGSPRATEFSIQREGGRGKLWWWKTLDCLQSYGV